MTHDVRNPDPGLGQAHTCGEVKTVNGIQPSLFAKWFSNGNTDINN